MISKQQILNWANNHYTVVAYLDNNGYDGYQYTNYETIVAIGVWDKLEAGENAWERWQQFSHKHQGEWLFAGLSYDLKNELEQLQSQQPDHLQFPLLHCFVPEHLFLLPKGSKEWQILSKTQAEATLLEQINQTLPQPSKKIDLSAVPLQSRFSFEEYCQSVRAILGHIIDGDVYEMNFCQEFFLENAAVEPLLLFYQLNEVARAPFSVFYKNEDKYLLCASPERFLKKEGNKIISQPIKGTTRRNRQDPQQDQMMATLLRQSTKDQAENVMIVDLVRNDLSRTCQWGTVQVEELFGIYAFEQVWQMISTISGELQEGVDWLSAIKNAFPMGSMTGAPKVMAMQLIEQYERSRRGWYSGAVGYVTPKGDFDWNVVIRSLFYNASKQYLSFQVGGAIVYDSIPEQEYEECLLKAQGILKILGKGLG